MQKHNIKDKVLCKYIVLSEIFLLNSLNTTIAISFIKLLLVRKVHTTTAFPPNYEMPSAQVKEKNSFNLQTKGRRLETNHLLVISFSAQVKRLDFKNKYTLNFRKYLFFHWLLTYCSCISTRNKWLL